MNLKENKDIDQLIPEGWEFREEYMEQALAVLKLQQRRAKWRKILGWSSAAAAILVVGSMLLHVCSSTRYLDETSQTALASENSKEKTELKSPRVSEAQQTEAHTKSADMDAATVPGDRSNPSVSTKRIASENNETNGHQSRSERVKSEGLNHTMIPGNSTYSTQTPNAGAKPVFSPLTLNRTSEQIPQGDSENTNGSTYMQNESIYSVSNMSTALWIASKEAHLGLPMSALKPNFYIGNTSRHSWSAIAGNAMWADYGRTQNTLSLQPIVGLGYQYRLTSKWGLTAQLLYSSIKDPGAVYSQTQIYYDYQQLQTTATIRTTRLHYGNLHLATQFRINTMWSASLGITSAIKITGHNTIERTGFNQLATQQKAMGYVSGFRRLNGGLTAALDRRLNSHTKLGLQYVFGLSDVSNDVEFSETAYHSNSQLNLMLTYTFK